MQTKNLASENTHCQNINSRTEFRKVEINIKYFKCYTLPGINLIQVQLI
jgi:hypothetical protein